MTKTNIRNDLLIALSLLARLPMPQPDWTGDKPAARAAWAYPVTGIIVAVLACAVGSVLIRVGLPPELCAGGILITLIMTTGAMHEDGLADCADGFWGGWDVERRLEIMRDSRIGAYGVIALTLSLLLRWAAITALIKAGIIWMALLAAAALSRAAMVNVMHRLPHARTDGLSRKTGRPGSTITQIATGIAVIAALGFFGWSGLWLLAVNFLLVIAISVLAKAKIGGQTGDVLGATQQISEITVLAALLALH